MNNINVIGIDLAKNVFQLHGSDKAGNRVYSKRVSRKKLYETVAQLPKCLIGIEACSSAHYWANQFQALGHEVRMMAPKYVKPYVLNNKNDANDAAAIAEAVTRPRTRFVPIKNREQQDIQALHRIREQQVKQRTMLSNQIRGLVGEEGIVMPQGISAIRKKLPFILEDASNNLSIVLRDLIGVLWEQFKGIDERLAYFNQQIESIAKNNEICQRLMRIPGIGAISATILLTVLGQISVFRNSRDFAAFLGLVPKQHSSGNTIVLKGISKQGNSYIRYLLIHGARAVIRHCDGKEDKRSQWLINKKNRSHVNVAAVALANKNARCCWAMINNNTEYHNELAA